MRLVDRIVAEDLPPPLLAALRDALQAVSGASGFATLEQDLVDGLFDRAELGDVEPAPLDDLWPHAELVLTVALTLAVADGHYGVEEARVIGRLAARLGYSAAGLAEIETRVFDELQAVGRRLRDKEA